MPLMFPSDTLKTADEELGGEIARQATRPLPVDRALRKFGSDLSLARRRRRLSQASMAERTGASLSTIRRIEKGDPRVPIHFYVSVLHVLGEIRAFEGLLDTAHDAVGLALMDERVPQRVRSRATPKDGW
jgi:DNA-binding XRE family transcriptional regulator